MLKDKLKEIINEDIKNLTEENGEVTINKVKSYLASLSSSYFDSNFIFVYDTLRKDLDMYKSIRSLFGPNSLVYIDIFRRDYISLHDFNTYPVAIEDKGFGSLKFIIGEVMYCTDEVFNYIKDIKIKAGYISSFAHLWIKNKEDNPQFLSVPYYVLGQELEAKIKNNIDKYPIIDSGDWIRYQSETEEKEEIVDWGYYD